MKKKRTLIFDLDDTLIDTMNLYRKSVDEFVEAMAKQGFRDEEVRDELNRIDIDNVSKLGFSRKRFPLSMVQTYESLCVRHNLSATGEVRRLCETIGNSVFERAPELFEGAIDTLIALRRRFRLMLLTKGDQSIQEARLDQTQIRHFFDAIYVVPDKTKSQLVDLIARESLNRRNTWMIGDSPRSDINPALAAGLRAIWIKRNTWDYEHQPIESGDVVILHSLQELRSFFDHRSDSVSE